MPDMLSSERDWRAVLDALPVAVSVSSAVRDDAGEIVDFRSEYVNPTSEAISGIPAAEQVGRLATEILPSFREMELFRDTCRVVQTGEPFVREALVLDEVLQGDRRVSGTFEIEARKFGDGVLSVSRDVSASRKAEEQLAEARTEVERRRFANQQVAEINDRILTSLVAVSRAVDANDQRSAQRAVQDAMNEASRIITDLQALPRPRAERR